MNGWFQEAPDENVRPRTYQTISTVLKAARLHHLMNNALIQGKKKINTQERFYTWATADLISKEDRKFRLAYTNEIDAVEGLL